MISLNLWLLEVIEVGLYNQLSKDENGDDVVTVEASGDWFQFVVAPPSSVGCL